MALTLDALAAPFPVRRFRWDAEDTRRYALGIGLGAQGSDADLPYLLGDAPRVVPTQSTIIAWDDSWIDHLGLDVTRIVHGEQRITLHQPLPAAGEVTSRMRIVEAVDKGPAKGALLYVETSLEDCASAAPLATLLSTVFARGDGGFGGPAQGGPVPHRLPDRAADMAMRQPVALNQAHIYRQSGDYNPLHVDPEFARAAGFPRPILHGLASYGMAMRHVLALGCEDDPTRVAGFSARFTAPVYPGETIETQAWVEDGGIGFRSRVVERDVIALDNGFLQLVRQA